MRNMTRGRAENAAKPPLRKRVKWDWLFLVVSVAVFTVLSIVFPDKGSKALRVSWEYLQRDGSSSFPR